MPVTAAYSGTFDPITFGHFDIIKRASKMYPKLIVAVGSNIAKNPKFTLDERVELIRKVVSKLKNVEVLGFSGLVVDFARENGVTVLVRGVRTTADFDHEKQMAIMNRGSEERRVWKEWVSTCRSRWGRDHSKKKTRQTISRR